MTPRLPPHLVSAEHVPVRDFRVNGSNVNAVVCAADWKPWPCPTEREKAERKKDHDGS